MIDYTVLGDEQTPEDIKATPESTGFCLIYVEETLSLKTSSIDTYGSIGQTHNTSSSILSASSKQTNHLTDYSSTVNDSLTDFEYASQELYTGKYSHPLKEVRQHPVLQSYFMSELKLIDKKLHDVE